MTTETKQDAKNALKQEVQSWLEANWDAQNKREQGASAFDSNSWLTKVRDARFAVPTWSSDWYGRDLSQGEARVIESAFAKVGAPGAAQDRNNLGAITVYKTGDDIQKAKFLPEMLGGAGFCLLYSEPGAGSDLAGVRTRADRDGDDFVITGQKVWTSYAKEATYGMLLARTDWDAPKREGISFFVFPMKQKGVEIRPINQINGESEFNEVFIEGARVPAANILGQENGGWRVFQNAIAYERLIMGEGAARRMLETQTGAPELVEMARRHNRIDDPVLRQKIAQTLGYEQINKLNLIRAKEEIQANGTSSLMSLGKLAMSRIQHGEAQVMADILGIESLLDGDGFSDAAVANFNAAKAYMNSIGGGTDQIQRNIIAEQILGLPREQEFDKGVAFKDVRTGI